MVIIFYDPEKEEICLCTEREKMKKIPVDDPNLLSYIPNDDILYVQNAHFITKRQFQQWLDGEAKLEEEPHRFTGFLDESPDIVPPDVEKFAAKHANSKWIHPAHNGTIHIPDITNEKYPHGLEMIGKWDFISVDSVGGFETLEESNFFKSFLAKGKIEVVGYDYVKKNYHKRKQVSASDAALEAILVKNDSRGSAEAAAASGGIDTHDPTGAIEFLVE